MPKKSKRDASQPMVAAPKHKQMEAGALYALRATALIFDEITRCEHFAATHPEHHALTVLIVNYLRLEVETVEDNGGDLSFLADACDVAQEHGYLLARLNTKQAYVIRRCERMLQLVDMFTDGLHWPTHAQEYEAHLLKKS